MTQPLPTPISRYFDAFNARQPQALGDSFSETAELVDEGRAFAGRLAIRAWEEEQLTGEARTIDVLTVSTSKERTAVVGRIHGDFPGSPHDRRFVFDLEGERIARLEISRVS